MWRDILFCWLPRFGAASVPADGRFATARYAKKKTSPKPSVAIAPLGGLMSPNTQISFFTIVTDGRANKYRRSLSQVSNRQLQELACGT